MTARKLKREIPNESDEIVRAEARLLEEELRDVAIPRDWREGLLDPEGWGSVLETFAITTGLAVAQTDPAGRLLGTCHNPQPTWQLARAINPGSVEGCPFCLSPPAFCTAVADAVKTGCVVSVEDQAGLAHVAVPLIFSGEPLGALIAGQVFSRYPEPLPLRRVARNIGISSQLLWQTAIQQAPVTRSTLEKYAGLLKSLGEGLLGQRYAALLQKRVAQTSRRYRLFFDGVKDYALFTMSPAGHVTSWNSGAERLFGYREAEMMGRDVLRLIAPERDGREELRQATAAADRSGWVEVEGWRVRKDGTRFLSMGVLSSMGEGDGREYGSLIRDVTESRRSAQDLQQAQKMEGIGVLAGGIAHDFNNLLTGITGSLSHVKTNLPIDDPSYAMLEIAEHSAIRAAELVAQLLAYAGKGKFVITRFDFSALISEMLPLIAASIPKTVKLELKVTPSLPWIEADASQIRQIVMNLIINGAEAIAPAGGTVCVSTGVLGSGTDVFMEVKDSGSGMSEATQAKMFDPFFTTKFTGRGLGLAAVSGIVRGHKGKMQVTSIPGHGTTFTVSFPAVAGDVVRSVGPVKPAPPATQHAGGTILVVDDEAVLRKMSGLILKNAGYTLLMAEDGLEAVEVFRQNAPDIVAVLLDMTMPLMSGQEAFEWIRAIRPDVPIVISSGYGEAFAREELEVDAVAGFVQKPYTAATLLEGISRALQSSSAITKKATS